MTQRSLAVPVDHFCDPEPSVAWRSDTLLANSNLMVWFLSSFLLLGSNIAFSQLRNRSHNSLIFLKKNATPNGGWTYVCVAGGGAALGR